MLQVSWPRVLLWGQGLGPGGISGPCPLLWVRSIRVTRPKDNWPGVRGCRRRCRGRNLGSPAGNGDVRVQGWETPGPQPPLPSRRRGTYVVEERAHVGRDQQDRGAGGGRLPRHGAPAERALDWVAAAASCGTGRAGVSRGRGASAAPGDSTGAHRGLRGSDRAWPGLQPRGRWLFAAPRPRARSPPRLTAARAQPLDPPGKFPQPPPPTPAGASPAPRRVGP